MTSTGFWPVYKMFLAIFVYYLMIEALKKLGSVKSK